MQRMIRMNCRRQIGTFVLALLMLAGSPASFDSAHAAGLLFNGDFESGDLRGWTDNSENGGIATVVFGGSCYSGFDTTAIEFAGNFAALIRSNEFGAIRSVGVITSDSFLAGDGIAFSGLSESNAVRLAFRPVILEVRILDVAGEILLSQNLQTHKIKPHIGCPSEPRHAPFSSHFVDTRPFAGQEIVIEFRQHTNSFREGFFTLIDEVQMFGQGEVPLFPGRPRAIAGLSVDSVEGLQLDGTLSFSAADALLEHNWFIDGETEPRPGMLVPLDDLAPGNYTALLVVSDGANVDTDQLRFVVADVSELVDGNATGAGDGNATDGNATGDGNATDGNATGGRGDTDEGS